MVERTTRYDRQEMIRGWNPTVIRGAKILVLGAGTTGNEIIKNLTLLGVGHIAVVDMDTVEEVNLSRSVLFHDEDINRAKAQVVAERAMQLNPHVEVTARVTNIVFDIGDLDYGGYDCVVLTVDNLEARMWVNRYCWVNQTPLIDTGIEALLGNVLVVASPVGPCIECDWSPTNYKRLADRYSCLKIGLNVEDAKIPMVITTASIIAGMAAQECVRLLHDKAEGSITTAGRSYWFDSEDGVFLHRKIILKDDCPGHTTLGDLITNRKIMDEAVSLSSTVSEVVHFVKRSFNTDQVEIWYDKLIVYQLVCDRCATVQLVEPTPLGRFRRPLCKNCGTLATRPHQETAQLIGDYTLEALGVPPNHLLKVQYVAADSVETAWVMTTK